ncbi:unnamed protein product (macronuclear) [Paramecium tetraurelia]|uniref:Uncharacterized protein n=1 Tax=Paramecium tetraurelia TaxID=5888 RepID=A0D5P5_PARTE|nr:uncharacterized protein GSPATT00013792001 [Paramecium tetraurelia]CAK78362.1 unnamed protein product [Paramecium tetraurelia]|eukprot:XP_001445759.1 hypothetical protein (macronuclear) [Paramecium tetraurelia strain d4-2]
MKILLLFVCFVFAQAECYYYQLGAQHYCQECCYWYDGEWFCETYQYCYTFIAITISIWIAICLIYTSIYFYVRNKTMRRIAMIHNRSAQAQRENSAINSSKRNEIPNATIEVGVMDVQISNDQL